MFETVSFILYTQINTFEISLQKFKEECYKIGKNLRKNSQLLKDIQELSSTFKNDTKLDIKKLEKKVFETAKQALKVSQAIE